MAGERKLQALLQWSVEKDSLNATVKALLPLKTELKEIDRLVAKISASMAKIKTPTTSSASGKSSSSSSTEISRETSKIKESLQAQAEAADDAAQALGEVYDALPQHVKAAVDKIIQETGRAVVAIRELKREFKVTLEDNSVAKISKTPPPPPRKSEPIALEKPTVSGDLSQTAGIAELIANKTEEVNTEASKVAQTFNEVEGQAKEAAAAVENIAQQTARATAEAKKLTKEELDDKLRTVGGSRLKLDKYLSPENNRLVSDLQGAWNDLRGDDRVNDPWLKSIKEIFPLLSDAEKVAFGITDEMYKAAYGAETFDQKVRGGVDAIKEAIQNAKTLAQEASKVAQTEADANAYKPKFERDQTRGGDFGDGFLNTQQLEGMEAEIRDSVLSNLTQSERAALGYREAVEQVSEASSEASKAQSILDDEIKSVAEKAEKGKLSLEEYLALLTKISQTKNLNTPEAATYLDQTGIKVPTAAMRKFLGQSAETGDKKDERLKVEYAIERALDKQAASLQDQLSEEEKIWAVIKRIASTLGETTRESAQLLSNYQGVSKETQKIAAKIGENPATVTQAKNARLASEAAKFAADGTRQNASEQERLANVVNAVGKALKMTTAEAARYVAKMKEGGGKSAEELEKITRKANEAKKAIGGMAGMQFGIAGFTTTMIGAQIEQFVKPFFQLPQKFAEYAGTSNTNAREWLQTMGQVEQAQMRIAQTVAKAILPAMEKFADWVTEAAAWAEDNPEWIKALTDGATILLGAAIALKAAGFALSAIGTAQNLTGLITSQLAKAGVGTAIGAGASTALLPTILALLPAVLLAGLAYFGLSKLSLSKLGVEGHDPNKSILEEGTKAGAQFTTLAAGGLTGLFSLMTGGTLEEARAAMTRTIMGIGELTGAVDDLGSASEQAAQKTDADKIIPPDNIVKGIASLLEQLVKLETQYEEERNKLIEDAGKERVDLEKEYEQQRKELIEDFNARLAELYAGYLDQVQDATENYAKTERRAEEDYYRRRMLAAQEFGKEMERLEQDHQDRLEKMRRDHLFNVEMLVASRDALGLAREMRRYEEERAQEEANHEKEARRRNEDFADRIKQMEEEFAIERARRREDFEDRLREIEEDYQRQKAKLAQQQADRLAELARQQEEENKMFGENLEEQLKLLDERYAKEREQMEKQIADQILLAESLGLTAQNIQLIYDTAVEYFSRLQTLRNQVLSSLNYRGYGGGLPGTGVPGAAGYGEGRSAGTKSTTIGFATGGYSYKSGLYALSEDNTREFVLSNPTVKALEKAGGHLTQDKVLAMTHRGVSPSGGEVMVRVDQNNWRIEGALTVAEKRALMKEVHEATYQAVKGVNRR